MCQNNVDLKLKQEILYIEDQRREIRVRLVFDIIKTLGFFIGAIVVFTIVQSPQSKEKIKAERTRLILDAIQIKEPQTRATALALIRKTYGEQPIKEAQNTEILLECSAVIHGKHLVLIAKKHELIKQLNKEVIGANGKPGFGSKAAALQRKIEALYVEIEYLNDHYRYCAKHIDTLMG